MGNSEAEPKIQGMNFITSKKVTSNDIWSKEPGLLSQRRRSLRTEFFGAKARQWTFRITHDNCQAMDSDAEPWGPKLGLCSHAALYLKLVAFLSFPIQFISSFGCPGSWSIHLKGLPASSLDHLLSHFKIAAQVIVRYSGRACFPRRSGGWEPGQRPPRPPGPQTRRDQIALRWLESPPSRR